MSEKEMRCGSLSKEMRKENMRDVVDRWENKKWGWELSGKILVDNIFKACSLLVCGIFRDNDIRTKGGDIESEVEYS
ncbi:hypothetical protein, partial [Staphylococcus warneri]|uniref:hypothetical protein n=1 Tax=Staphylococcus warneri TaxID=1292 RepID=UPI0011A8A0D5